MRKFDKLAYCQRPKMETVVSVEKKTMRSHVPARHANQQQRDPIFRAFANNSMRMDSFFLLITKEFYIAGR